MVPESLSVLYGANLLRHLRLFVLFSGFAIEPVDPVVDKRKSVGKLLATAVSLSMACPSCPEGLELIRRNRPQVHR